MHIRTYIQYPYVYVCVHYSDVYAAAQSPKKAIKAKEDTDGNKATAAQEQSLYSVR